MRILIIESSKVVRDQILVGLQNFPEFAVEASQGFAGLNKARQNRYDCVFIGARLDSDMGREFLDHFRATDSTTDLVLVTSTRKVKGHLALRARYDVFSILYVPIDPKEFFRVVARLRRKESPMS